MHEPQLFRLAHEGISISAYWDHAGGWRLIARARRGDEPWSDTERHDFSHLSTQELCDVICAWLDSELGL